MLLTTRMVAKIVRPDIALGSAVRTEGVANTFVSTKTARPDCRLLLRVTAALNGFSKRILYDDPSKHFVKFVIMSTDP